MMVPLLSALLVALVASCWASSPEGAIPTFNLEDVSQPPVADGNVRLADGPTELEGRVEISYNGSWFAVCDYIFGIEEADVVCRQLGFDAAIASRCCSQYGYTDLPGILNQVECTGSEDNLLSCPHTEAGYGNCRSYSHAGVVCRRELTPCPLPVGPTIDWDAAYQCINPYYQLFMNINNPRVPGEVSPFLTIANLMDAVGAVWDSDSLVQGMGYFCRLVAPRQPAPGPGVFRGVCDPVLTALSDGTDLDGEQICRFVYSFAMPRPYTGAPYTPDTSTPYTPSTETPRTPGGLSTDYPISFSSIAPFICIFPIEYLSFSESPPLGVDAFQNLDIVTLLTQAVENVLNITSYDEDTVCSAVGHLTSREYAPRDIAIDFMAELLADLYPVANEICTNWDDIVETILSESSSYFYSFDVGVMVDEIPALIALLTDYPDRETLCLSIRTATLLGEDAVYASARSLVESIVNVLTTQEKCVSLIDSTLTVITDTSDEITLDDLEQYSIPFYTGFDDVQEICQYLETSFGPRYPPLQVRLVGGETPNEGRVEVQYAGEWGTVCDDGFDNDDAKVVCRQLGYRGEAVSLGNQRPGTGEILLDDVGCLGVESNIGQCPNAGITVHNCDHNEDVSVTCSIEVTPQPSPPSQPWTTPSSTDNGFLLTRLVGGSTENEGRLEVFYQGHWGTVCDDFWNAHNTDVACRSLGFQGGESFSCCAEYGEGDGLIILDDVDCTGEEDSIASCGNAGPFNHDCTHIEDIGISCIPNGAGTSAVRLVGGNNEAEGRVEINYNGVWGTICDDDWDITDANVVCRMLGFQGTSGAPGSAQFGQGTGPIQLDNVGCSGDEETIFDCEHPGFGAHNCGHYEDAGVVCIASADVRLVGGSNEAEGTVEIQHNGVWGTICDDSWGIEDADVVCHMLGFQSASSAPGLARFGQGTGPIQLDEVSCSGDEQTIFDCAHHAFGVHDCTHYEDAGVVCVDTSAVRLVGGSNEAEGRVEIQYNGVWGTICDDDWDINDASVVCRMLGFQGASGAPGSAQFGQGTGPIQLDDVGCSGDEQTIFDCAYPAFGVHNCGHYEDAGVICIA
ncbi:deleted in malignant brain tumors 1 protein isoform X2 [Strongylocentrotus purpuratus]|uniref:SRCR domain-containing protein n=1 Tax=Strongylocentrotus purpuratus TaxID=7668 RepID=A0A7M7P310_STRPU|nr:deleted in malignant brain tumors 1 protein isoform X2 [Strongylocentrotus purpuratus]